MKASLHQQFTIIDLGHARYLLGVEIDRSSAITYLTQRKYVLDILKDMGLLGAKLTLTSLPKGHKLNAYSSPPFSEPYKYIRLIERLLYLNMTIHDLTFVVQ